MARFILLSLIAWCSEVGIGQTPCNGTYATILGSVIDDEKGYSLTASLDHQFIYVGGVKNDSAIIIKLSIPGTIHWVRSFDLVPGTGDHIHKIFMDSEGMIGAAGTAGTQNAGGTIFAFRYDPDANVVLWANEYRSTSTNYCLGMIELGAGKNYLLSNNPTSPNLAELIELDRNTGDVVPAFSKHYDLGSSESFYDFAVHDGYLFGSGRFSDGGSTSEMRNTLAKIDPTDGTVKWMKLGHRNGNVAARLYGFDLLISGDQIYEVYSGDENGASVDDTRIFMQKSTLDGGVLWVKSYDLPGVNDWVDEIIESNGGFVILARNRVSPSNMILFKTNTNGDILWAYAYDFSVNDNATPIGSVQSQLIEVDNYLFFTAYAQSSGQADMILVKTDASGWIQDTCLAATPISIITAPVSNPVFYSIDPQIDDYVPTRITLFVQKGTSTNLASKPICASSSVSETFITSTLCPGDTLEGYYEEGIFIDTLMAINGCDSVRTLQLSISGNTFSNFDVPFCEGEAYGYSAPGTYTDTLISSGGCDSIRTVVIHGAAKYTPNVFSPNGDDVNDRFEIISYPDNELNLIYFAIYDRMGNMAYEKRTWPLSWDGRDKSGQYYNPAVFTYVLKYKCNADEIIETGSITLIR